MTTPTVDRIHLTYDEALKVAKILATNNPENITPHAYFTTDFVSREQKSYCIISKIIEAVGFEAPLEWWTAKRHNGEGLFFSASQRFNTHIRFLSNEIFSNEDLSRDAFLATLQTRQDNRAPWAKAVKHSESYVTRINLRNPQQ